MFAALVVGQRNAILLLWFKLHTFTHKVNGSSAYYKVVFLVLLFISWSVVSCPPRIYLSCYLWCLALWQALSRRRLQSGTYCSCLATRHSSTLLSAWLPTLPGFTMLGAIGIAGCHSLVGAMLGCHWRGAMQWVPLLGCHCWAPLWRRWLDAIARCHCPMLATNSSGVHVGWVPLLGAIARSHCLGAIVRCHCWVPLLVCHCPMLATNSSGVHVGWVPLLGAIARSHCLGAIVRCHCWVPLLVCHCWVPLWGAMAGCHCWCHCWVPLRETIARKN